MLDNAKAASPRDQQATPSEKRSSLENSILRAPVRQKIPLRIALFTISVGLAFWPLGSDLFAWARSDSPLGFVLLVPPVSIYLAWQVVHRATFPGRGTSREPFLDGTLAGCALVGAGLLLVVAPHAWGPWFWFDRDDLLAVPLVLFANVVILWGTDAALSLWSAWIYLFLLWPAPWILLYGLIAPTLAAVTSAIGIFVLNLASPGIAQLNQANVITIGSGATAFPLAISTACSGVSGVLGILAIGAPLVLTGKRPWRHRTWIILGAIAASFVGNSLRIVIIAWAVDLGFRTIAASIIHPVLGLGLFVLIVVGIWLLALPARSGSISSLRVGLRPSQKDSSDSTTRTTWLIALVLLVGVTVAVLEATVRQQLPTNDSRLRPLPIPAESLLRSPLGWKVQRYARLTWAEPFFGPGSHVELYRLSTSRRSDVWAQVVVTSDGGALSSHGVMACDLFHGDNVISARQVSIQPGITANDLLVRDSFGHDFEEVSWDQPVQDGTQTSVRRVALIDYPGSSTSNDDAASLVTLASDLAR